MPPKVSSKGAKKAGKAKAVRTGDKKRRKKRKEREREAKVRMYNYEGKGVQTLSEANAQKVNAQYQEGKQAARQTRQEATSVNMAAAGLGVEQASRAADHEREKAWKETQRRFIFWEEKGKRGRNYGSECFYAIKTPSDSL